MKHFMNAFTNKICFAFSLHRLDHYIKFWL